MQIGSHENVSGGFNVVAKSSFYFLSTIGHAANVEIPTMRQVVAYKRLKTTETYETVSSETWSRSLTGGGRLREVPTVRFRIGENFHVICAKLQSKK